MLKLISIFIGGGLGSCTRWLLSLFLGKNFDYEFPIATFTINIVGSFILGFLSFYFLEKIDLQEEVKLAILVGFCGGFTTFSTFAFENVNLIQNGAILKSALYIIGSVAISIFMANLGFIVAKNC